MYKQHGGLSSLSRISSELRAHRGGCHHPTEAFVSFMMKSRQGILAEHSGGRSSPLQASEGSYKRRELSFRPLQPNSIGLRTFEVQVAMKIAPGASGRRNHAWRVPHVLGSEEVEPTPRLGPRLALSKIGRTSLYPQQLCVSLQLMHAFSCMCAGSGPQRSKGPDRVVYGPKSVRK
jgi:hypothetical protein